MKKGLIFLGILIMVIGSLLDMYLFGVPTVINFDHPDYRFQWVAFISYLIGLPFIFLGVIRVFAKEVKGK